MSRYSHHSPFQLLLDQVFFFLAIVELVLVAVEERVRRERLRDLAVFERLHGDPAKTSSTLAVKKVL